MNTGIRIASIAIAAALGLGGAVAPAQAAATKFTSCDKMHRVYSNGINKSSAAANLAVKSGMKRPIVAPKVYENSYKTLDRDKDGTMCEVPR